MLEALNVLVDFLAGGAQHRSVEALAVHGGQLRERDVGNFDGVGEAPGEWTDEEERKKLAG